MVTWDVHSLARKGRRSSPSRGKETWLLRQPQHLAVLHAVPQLFTPFTAVHVVTLQLVSSKEGGEAVFQGDDRPPKPAGGAGDHEPSDVLHDEGKPALGGVAVPAGARLGRHVLVDGRVELGQVLLARNGQRQVLERLHCGGHPVAGETLHKAEDGAVEDVGNDAAVALLLPPPAARARHLGFLAHVGRAGPHGARAGRAAGRLAVALVDERGAAGPGRGAHVGLVVGLWGAAGAGGPR